eukprot:scaffold10237_cov252-Skeletonema_marinoi.AAC.1
MKHEACRCRVTILVWLAENQKWAQRICVWGAVVYVPKYVFVESWRHGICIVQMPAGDRRQAMPSMCPKSYNALHGFTYCANNSFTYAARPLLSGNISTVVSGKIKDRVR